MAVQENYAAGLRPAVEGANGTMVPSTFISRSVQNDAGITFGKPVGQHPTIDGGCIPFADGGKLLGFTVRERSITAGGIEGFNKFDSARIKTKGDIWLKVTTNVKAGDPVFVGAAALTNAAGANLVAVDAQFETSASAGALALVRLK